MTEIDYGRLDALEAILGGRAAINDAYLKGKSYASPGAVINIGSAPSEDGATGDLLLVRSDGTVHRYTPPTISAAAFVGFVADAYQIAFTSVNGTTLNYNASPTDAGKLVCIPGAGADDGSGNKDGFTTTIASVNPGVSATLTNAVTTAVSTGSNRVAAIGTNNDIPLANFLAALPGKRGHLPPGNIMFSTGVSLASLLAAGTGLGLDGAGAGATTGAAATSLWFAGPINSIANGAGGPAMMAASTTGLELFGLKLRGFGIQCLRPLAASTTVNGAGQVINTVASALTVASTAGFPTRGLLSVTGVTTASSTEVQYTGISGNQFTGCTVLVGSGTATNGGVVRLITAGLALDFVSQASAEDVVVTGYTDNTGAHANANQGHGVWVNNLSSGCSNFQRVHARSFGGTNCEGWRIGTQPAGYGVRGNGGNSVFSAVTAIQCFHGFHLVGTGGVDGMTFNSPKAIGTGATAAAGARGFWLEYGNLTINSPHSESFPFAYYFDSAPCYGAVVNAPIASWQGASAGDGSAAFTFNGGASANMVNGGCWQGWTGGTPGAPSGTPGFAFGAVFSSSSTGNRLRTRIDVSRGVPGTAHISAGGTGNRYVDLSNPWDIGPIIIPASNATWAVPPGAQVARITCVGGGGGGGGGGSASSAITQTGGSGGTAGMTSTQTVQIGTNTTLAVTVGVVGGGGNGGNAGGFAGSSGGTGGTTSVTGTGISVLAKGGLNGRGSAANSTATANGDTWGTSLGGGSGAVISAPGMGGPATSTQGLAGGDNINSAGGGGGGGMASSTTLGGAGGNAGSLTGGAATQTSQAGTQAGTIGANAAANSGAGGGGGGGGAWNGGTSGAGGAGGNGGTGVVIIEFVG